MKILPRGWFLPFAVTALLVTACGETKTEVCSPTDPACDPDPGGGGTPDPLEVVQVVPADGSTDVDPAATVTVTFSRSVAAASVTSSSVSVGTAAGDLSVSGAIVTFTPTAGLDEGASYGVSVNGVTDDDGVGLDDPFSSSFSTRSSPVAASAGPDIDATVGSTVTLDGSASTGTGATFTWTQLSGPGVGGPLNGKAPTFTAPSDVSTLSFELSSTDGTTTDVDTVRVWVVEDAAQTMWVSAGGSDANPGTRASPLATIQAAIDAADNGGNGADVYVAAGAYDETLTLRSRVSVYGGFEPGTWIRDVATHRPVVSGQAIAVRGQASNDLTLEGLDILAAHATGVGASSIALLLDASTGVTLRWNAFTAGNGTGGAAGTTGDPGRRGSNGSGGANPTSLCVPGSPGGNGGSNYRAGGKGGSGGLYGGFGGAKGSGTSGGNAGGGGSTGNNGGGGGDGKAAGAAGPDGAAGTLFGGIDANGYQPAGGQDGLGTGAPGFGGGGGGGGGGTAVSCGPGGGGGGGGGEGGQVGTKGLGGGASIGVLLLGQTVAQIVDNGIATGSGGNGGSGGAGGSGGPGGSGASGGAKGCELPFNTPCTGVGGKGGNGTSGGRGGHGGGGGGGPSIGIVEGPAATATVSGNTFTLGTPGAGGASGGNAGATGESADHKKLN
jgi:hypothetical protein